MSCARWTPQGKLIPGDVTLTVTRNYGLTAAEKSNELLWHMGIAVIGVTILIGLVLGWRESGVVAVAIPRDPGAHPGHVLLPRFYPEPDHAIRADLFHRDPRRRPDRRRRNIVRHFRMPRNKGRPLLEVTIEAVNEVRSP